MTRRNSDTMSAVLAPDARKSEWNGTLADAIERLGTLARFIDEVCRTSRDGFARVMMHRDDTAAIARVLAALEIHPHPHRSARPRTGAPTLGDATGRLPERVAQRCCRRGYLAMIYGCPSAPASKPRPSRGSRWAGARRS